MKKTKSHVGLIFLFILGILSWALKTGLFVAIVKSYLASMAVHAYDPSTQEAKPGGYLAVRLYLENKNHLDGEMTQWLRALAALPEDLRSVHTLTCNSPLSVTQTCMPATTPAYKKIKN